MFVFVALANKPSYEHEAVLETFIVSLKYHPFTLTKRELEEEVHLVLVTGCVAVSTRSRE